MKILTHPESTKEDFNRLPYELHELAPRMHRYFTQIYKPRPLERLKPRSSLRGGRVEMFVPRINSCDLKDGLALKYFDCVSLYPHCAMQEEYPVGQPEILIREEDLKKLVLREGKCFYEESGNSIEVEGLCQIRVLCCQTEYPFLGYKMTTEGEKEPAVFFSLCRTCTLKLNKNPCSHSEEQRAFFTTCTIHEAAIASMYGDQGNQIH